MKIKSLEESEKDHLSKVLEQTHWDLEKASRLLQISMAELKSKIAAYGINPSEPKET